MKKDEATKGLEDLRSLKSSFWKLMSKSMEI
jgi:hypothetical protein